jgi:Na+-translocating ferredoxin:NAD+ oxidoreductase RnfG subunit
VLLLGCSVFISSTVARAETFLTEQQALKVALPDSEQIRTQVRTLTPAQREELQQKTRLRFSEPEYKFYIGEHKGQVNGYALIVNELGKHELITFIVGVDANGKVGQVAVMEYRESRGGEVREKRFLRQFKGKSLSDPIRVDEDITNYTGATLSSHAIARGVRKALLLTSLFFLGGKP